MTSPTDLANRNDIACEINDLEHRLENARERLNSLDGSAETGAPVTSDDGICLCFFFVSYIVSYIHVECVVFCS